MIEVTWYGRVLVIPYSPSERAQNTSERVGEEDAGANGGGKICLDAKVAGDSATFALSRLRCVVYNGEVFHNLACMRYVEYVLGRK